MQSLPRRQTRVATWPVVTVFGAIARPRVHLFVKPMTMRRAAEAYAFDLRYAARPSWSTYSNVLELATTVRGTCATSGPATRSTSSPSSGSSARTSTPTSAGPPAGPLPEPRSRLDQAVPASGSSCAGVGTRRSMDDNDTNREIVEPPNSTVNDWHGQKVSDDEEMIDEVLERTGGDVAAAEREFEEHSANKDPERDISKPKPS